PYFLEPVGRSPKSYVLLRRTLEETERTAIVTFTLRTKTRLGVLRVHDDLMVLQTMRWPKDLREVDFAPSGKKSEPKAKEVEMAGALVAQFSDDFDPAQFTDEYQEQLRTLLDEKLEKGETVDTAATFGEEREQQKERGRGRQGAQPDGCPRAQRDQATRLRDRQRQGGIRIGEVLRFATVLRLDEELGLEEVRLLGRFREEQLLRERIIE